MKHHNLSQTQLRQALVFKSKVLSVFLAQGGDLRRVTCLGPDRESTYITLPDHLSPPVRLDTVTWQGKTVQPGKRGSGKFGQLDNCWKQHGAACRIKTSRKENKSGSVK